MTSASLRIAGVPVVRDLFEPAAALFDALTDTQSPACHTLGRLPTPGEIADADIRAAWPFARVVSFDVFDTLLVRKVAAPRDVFLHLATPAPFAAWSLDPVVLAQHRQEAENDARRRGMIARGSMEVTLQEIHTVLAERLRRPTSDIPAMVRAEQLVERALCVAHPHLREVFNRAVHDGKVIWCVSDTYHEATFLRELLSECGYALQGVDVVSSADLRASKGEGRVLKQLAATAGVAADAVLHIGDHPRADFAIPAQQGFLAVLHPWAASRHEDRVSSCPGDSIAMGLAQIGSRTVEPGFPFWWRFGYAVAGPLLSAFATWLESRLTADGIDRAYFLLRDGEIILDVYNALHENRPGPALSLLESSRRAFVVPALEIGNASMTAQLLACENPRHAGEFLERVGLRARDFGAAFRAVGVSAETVVSRDNTAGMTAVAALFSRPDVAKAMLAVSRTERRLLCRYLAQEGVLSPGRIGLVDIGWNGTIQKGLLAVASLERTALDVRGYYLGTHAGASADLMGSEAIGFLFNAGAPHDHARAVQQLQQLVEFICTTARGSLRGFRVEGVRTVALHGAVDHPEPQLAAIRQLRDGAVAYARGLAEERQVFGAHPISVEAALRHFVRTVRQPTAEEAAAIGDITHGEGLGADRARAFAKFTDAPFTAASLQRDYAAAYWPAGLLARREPAALALRSLLWLRGG